eukprot:Pgem_evm1s15175
MKVLNWSEEVDFKKHSPKRNLEPEILLLRQNARRMKITRNNLSVKVKEANKRFNNGYDTDCDSEKSGS